MCLHGQFVFMLLMSSLYDREFQRLSKVFLIQPTNCLSVFDHFVGLALKGLITTLSKREVSKVR